MKYVFITNQFCTGGVETVFTNIANFTNKKLFLLPIHDIYDNKMIENLPKNVELISSNINPKRTVFGMFQILFKSFSFRKKYHGQDYTIINFSDTLSSLLAASIIGGRNAISWIHINPDRLVTSKTSKIYIYLLKKCAKIVFICEDEKKEFNKLIDANLTKEIVCTNFVSIDRINMMKNDSINIDFEYILMISRLDETQKDFKTLFLAYKKLPEAIKNKYKLVIGGDGPSKNELINFAKELSLTDKIVFLGNLENPYKWMTNCKIYVHSSKFEGFPMVLIEALACGCNIVSSNCKTGPSEILEKGKYGELFTPGNVDELQNAILRALEKKSCKTISEQRSMELTEIGKRQLEVFLA